MSRVLTGSLVGVIGVVSTIMSMIASFGLAFAMGTPVRKGALTDQVTVMVAKLLLC